MQFSFKRFLTFKAILTLVLSGIVLLAFASLYFPSLEPIVSSLFLFMLVATLYCFPLLAPAFVIYCVWRWWRFRKSRDRPDRNKRRKELVIALLFLLVIGSCQGLGHLRHGQFIRQYTAASQRLQPLVTAINEFKNEHAKYPDTLDELVPDYITAIPESGMGDADVHRTLRYSNEGTTFSIKFFAPHAGLSFDTFVYRSDKDYRFETVGGIPELIGDWAYVHE